jgi:hypothetical protein
MRCEFVSGLPTSLCRSVPRDLIGTIPLRPTLALPEEPGFAPRRRIMTGLMTILIDCES